MTGMGCLFGSLWNKALMREISSIGPKGFLRKKSAPALIALTQLSVVAPEQITIKGEDVSSRILAHIIQLSAAAVSTVMMRL